MKIDLLNSKDDLYLLALKYLNQIESDEFNISDFTIENNSISYLIDHKFIPVPRIKIELHLIKNDCISSNYNYSIYIDEDKTVIDEFLFI